MPKPPSRITTVLYFLDWLPVAGPPLDPNRCGRVHALPDAAQLGIRTIEVHTVHYLVRGDGLFLAAVLVRHTGTLDAFRIASLMRALSSAIKEDRGHVHIFHEKARHSFSEAPHHTGLHRLVAKLWQQSQSEANVGLHPPVMVTDPYDPALAAQVRARDPGFIAPVAPVPTASRGAISLLPDMERCFANPIFVAHLREVPVSNRSRNGLTAIQALRYEILNQRDAALETYALAGERTRYRHKGHGRLISPLFAVPIFLLCWALFYQISYLFFDFLNIKATVRPPLSMVTSIFLALIIVILALAYHHLKSDLERRLKILLHADGYQKACAPFFHAAQVIFAAGGGRAGDAPGYTPGDVFAPLIKRAEVRMMRHSVLYQMIVGLLGAVMAVVGVVATFRAEDPKAAEPAAIAAPPAASVSSAPPAAAPSPAAAICPPEASVTICLPPAKGPR